MVRVWVGRGQSEGLSVQLVPHYVDMVCNLVCPMLQDNLSGPDHRQATTAFFTHKPAHGRQEEEKSSAGRSPATCVGVGAVGVGGVQAECKEQLGERERLKHEK